MQDDNIIGAGDLGRPRGFSEKVKRVHRERSHGMTRLGKSAILGYYQINLSPPRAGGKQSISFVCLCLSLSFFDLSV